MTVCGCMESMESACIYALPEHEILDSHSVAGGPSKFNLRHQIYGAECDGMDLWMRFFGRTENCGRIWISWFLISENDYNRRTREQWDLCPIAFCLLRTFLSFHRIKFIHFESRKFHFANWMHFVDGPMVIWRCNKNRIAHLSSESEPMNSSMQHFVILLYSKWSYVCVCVCLILHFSRYFSWDSFGFMATTQQIECSETTVNCWSSLWALLIERTAR